MANYFPYILAGLQHRKLRSWLTITGIIIGIASIIALISLSQGMERAIADQFSKLGTDIIQIAPAELRGPPTGELGLPNELIKVAESIKETDYANPLILNFASIGFKKEKELLFVNGYDTSLSGKGFLDADIAVEEGRLFSSGERNVAVIGNDVSRDTFDSDIRAKNSITIEDEKYRVIGVFEQTGSPLDDRVYISLDDAKDIFNQHETVNIIAVKMKPNVDMVAAQNNLQRALERKVDKETFDLFTPEQILEQFKTILGVLQIVLVGIAAISLLVGAIGIMNSMYTSVLERTREIGVMKAIGARNGDIFTIFVIESGIIGLVGGIGGIITGIGIAKGIEFVIIQTGFSLIHVTFSPILIFGGIIFSVIVGIISGTAPSIRASRLQPVDALRYE